MLERLEKLAKTHQQLMQQLADPEVLSDQNRYREVNQSMAEIAPAVDMYHRYRDLLDQQEQNQELLESIDTSDELHSMVMEEKAALETAIEGVEDELHVELTPKDPNDQRNVVLEIRAGTGGDEATLFASELFRMYTRFAEQNRWKVDIIDVSESGVQGVKEVSCIVEGRGAYSKLKFEAGVHRVQRVPKTEASGRIHTSAVTVAVLPEADDVEVAIDEKDLRIDRFCSSGPGGQGVNTTYSAVRITHLSTNIVVSCQDERSQIKNRQKAMRVLKSRLLEIEQEKAQSELSAERRKMVGSGDRSEKIRTYNFPQSRVTDHRIGLTLHRLGSVLEGDLDELIDALSDHWRAKSLETSLDTG